MGIFIIAALAAYSAWVIIMRVRKIKRGEGCGCGCGSCRGCDKK